ncbi:MAG: TonB-dependent receptor [Clostridiales bacterium]|nr:TonB-dependent receptor [Clostridiales bacterium]
MNNWKRISLAMLGILLLSGLLSAQGPAPSGRIYGTVTDQDGNPLPGVAVEATSPSLVGKASTVTDASGIYRLFALHPGTYRITFTLQGFKPLIREGIIISIDQTLKLDVSLEMGALEEEVTVIGKSPLIDIKSTTKGMTLSKEMFEVLPRGRNFDSLVTAVPGVNYEPWAGGLSVDGATVAENVYFIDGSNVMRVDTGRPQQSAAFEFVDEVKIIASGYGAEHGGALGGVVSVITRQGGNEYHGELIGYYSGSMLSGSYRDELRLNPRNIMIAEYVNYQTGKNLELYPGKDKHNRYEGGFSLGGYILKDRLWFFGSVLPVYETQVRKGVFLAEPDFTQDYTLKDYAYNFSIKITGQPVGFMRLGASFVNNFTKSRGRLPERDGSSSPTDPTLAKYGWDYPNYSANAFADFTFGNNFMVNMRGGRFMYDRTNQQYTADVPRQYHSGDGIGVYVSTTDPRYRVRAWQTRPRIYETKKYLHYKNYFNSDFTYYLNLAGEHAFKFGVEWVRQGEDVDSTISSEFPEVFLNWNRPLILGGVNYGKGDYGYYEVRGSKVTGPFGEWYNVYNDRWALYFQDSWTIADKFTLNVGIRAESEYVPAYTTEEALKEVGLSGSFKPLEFGWGEKIAPRIGFIYDVFGDASLKIFGSYGLYFDVIKTYMAAHSYAGFKWKSAYYKLETLDWQQIGVGGNFPGELMQIFDWRHPSFESTDPDLKPVSQREISFGAEKMLMENLSFTTRFVQKHLRHIIEDVGVIVPGVGEVYYECNPGFGYSLHEGHGTGKFDPKYPETPKAKREYYALNLSLEKRLANNWLAGFSYTWSRLTGNTSGLAASDEYGRVSPYVERMFDNWAMAVTKDLGYIDGPLPTDRPHFFKAYGAYTFPFRLTIGAVVNAMSGVPFTETWSILGTYWYPFNRHYYRDESGNLKQKRTPFHWIANVYAEYNLRLGKYTLNFNVNVDNIFDVKTAHRLYNYRTLYGLNVSEAEVLSKNWDLTVPSASYRNYVQDPRWMKEMNFYGSPGYGSRIAARLGVKFIF